MRSLAAAVVLGCAGAAAAQDSPAFRPGSDAGTGRVVTGQVVHPAGESLSFEGRPVDVAVSGDGQRLFVKDDDGLTVIDLPGWRVAQRLSLGDDGTSACGVAVSADGRQVFISDAKRGLHEAVIGDGGAWDWARRINLAGPEGKGSSYPCGVALLPGGSAACVCLSRNDALGIVDLASGKLGKQIPVGAAPFGVVVSADGKRAFVSNWGGRRAAAGDRTAPSSGTPIVVDGRGIAASGTVTIVDLERGEVIIETEVGLHPCGMAMSPDGMNLAIACAASDRVTVLDTSTGAVAGTMDVRPDPSLAPGSSPQALAFSADGRTLYVANGGDNAIVVMDLGHGLNRARLAGLIPTGWYPGAVAVRGSALLVANVKGLGSLGAPEEKKRRVQASLGTVERIAFPDGPTLERMTAEARSAALVPEALAARKAGDAAAEPVPVPAAVGQKSVFEHVVYVIKENRTYDQVYGDIGRGNSDPSMCIYGREVTPNQHSLAEEFVLLDNFYCNSVKSADGHAWVCEGNAGEYIERSFGGFTRSYDYGTDPLQLGATGPVWEHALAKGLSVRNYGEIDFPRAKVRTVEWLRALKDGSPLPPFTHHIPIEHLKGVSSPTYPGWNLDIPDAVRADAFLKELSERESEGSFPNLAIVYLPSDHTSGTTAGHPTPRAQVADNDLALGQIVEGICRSKFWPTTCIFVVEDDPQDGFDHVDGHRSGCLIISPYTKRHALVSQFYNQASVLHTIERILGIAAANHMYALAPLMTGCFDTHADFTPFAALPNRIPLDELNPEKTSLRGEDLRWEEASERLALEKPDLADEDVFNRILWHAARAGEAYPEAWAGAHGKGLAALGLSLSAGGPAEHDGDDDEPAKPSR